jgi:hypothetical protein
MTRCPRKSAKREKACHPAQPKSPVRSDEPLVPAEHGGDPEAGYADEFAETKDLRYCVDPCGCM